MSWYYADWTFIQNLITLATLALFAFTVVAACVALVRSHRYGDGRMDLTNEFAAPSHTAVLRQVPAKERHLSNGHRAA